MIDSWSVDYVNGADGGATYYVAAGAMKASQHVIKLKIKSETVTEKQQRAREKAKRFPIILS